MKARGTYCVPTISAWNDADKDENPVIQLRGRAMQPRGRDTTARAWKMGIKIVAGTDNNYEAASSRGPAGEIIQLVRSGMPPMEAIESGTSVSAGGSGVGRRVGAIKPGMGGGLGGGGGAPL